MNGSAAPAGIAFIKSRGALRDLFSSIVVDDPILAWGPPKV